MHDRETNYSPQYGRHSHQLRNAIDDWQFSTRITSLCATYAQLVPELSELLGAAAGAEQATAMLTGRTPGRGRGWLPW